MPLHCAAHAQRRIRTRKNDSSFHSHFLNILMGFHPDWIETATAQEGMSKEQRFEGFQIHQTRSIQVEMSLLRAQNTVTVIKTPPRTSTEKNSRRWNLPGAAA
jgi:hypothetical protein